MRLSHAEGAIISLTVAAGAAAGGGCPLVLHEPGDVPYRSFCDSPWGGIAPEFDYFVIETFEDGAADARGLVSPGGIVAGRHPNCDSIDLDGDGSLDGVGVSGYSYFYPDLGGGAVARLSFDEAVLGALPTHAGLVWTDGRPGQLLVTFEAFDRNGELIGTRAAELGDDVNTGTTDEDRFFGVEYADGVSTITIASAEGFLEIDHVQYGFDPNRRCIGDLDQNGFVDFDDILELLVGWGPCPEDPCCADLNGDGLLGFEDLLRLLGAWGPCP